jgi:cell division protein FtsX
MVGAAKSFVKVNFIFVRAKVGCGAGFLSVHIFQVYWEVKRHFSI